MKKILFVTLLLSVLNNIYSIEINADLFTYDEKKIEEEFAELNEIESIVKNNPQTSFSDLIVLYPNLCNSLSIERNSPLNIASLAAPGNFSSFWFAFTFSAIGTYFIYSAVAGPITVGIVYFSSNKDKIETKKAIWGCIAGTLVGAGIKLVVVSMM